jgi:membrane protein
MQSALPGQVSGGHDAALGKGLGWLAMLFWTARKFSRDRCTMSAGSLAYQWFLALFPALIALLGLTSLVHLNTTAVQRLINGLNRALPPGASGVLTEAVHHAVTRSDTASLAALLAGIVVAVWSSTSGMATLQTALDVAYEVRVDRGFVAKRLRSVPLILVTIAAGGLTAALIVFGQPLGTAIGSLTSMTSTAFTIAWDIARWIVAVVLISLLFSFYYFYGPNRETPRWRWVSPGGLIGSAVFLAASEGFSFYVSKFGSYGRTYGALAGVVILLLWLYLIGVAVLFGGSLNAVSERAATLPASDREPPASTAPPTSSLLVITDLPASTELPARAELPASTELPASADLPASAEPSNESSPLKAPPPPLPRRRPGATLAARRHRAR